MFYIIPIVPDFVPILQMIKVRLRGITVNKWPSQDSDSKPRLLSNLYHPRSMGTSYVSVSLEAS